MFNEDHRCSEMGPAIKNEIYEREQWEKYFFRSLTDDLQCDSCLHITRKLQLSPVLFINAFGIILMFCFVFGMQKLFNLALREEQVPF